MFARVCGCVWVCVYVGVFERERRACWCKKGIPTVPTKASFFHFKMSSVHSTQNETKWSLTLYVFLGKNSMFCPFNTICQTLSLPPLPNEWPQVLSMKTIRQSREWFRDKTVEGLRAVFVCRLVFMALKTFLLPSTPSRFKLLHHTAPTAASNQ